MLPDIPSLKSELESNFIEEMKKLTRNNMGAFAESPRYLVKEGSADLTERPDGTRDNTNFELVSGSFKFELDEIPLLTYQDIVAKLEGAAREMAGQMSKHALANIAATTEKTGNKISGDGGPLNSATLLELMDKVEYEFDDDGKHHPMTFVVPPDQVELIHELLRNISVEPTLRAKYQAIMARKWEEWRAREACRKLVG